ncbi:uncharacterized protein LOC107274739 isoform X2 [Cephus cinctus]|nr:uncharacterized protein LOC107274739 isoform X2 [Cephus cinctus]
MRYNIENIPGSSSIRTNSVTDSYEHMDTNQSDNNALIPSNNLDDSMQNEGIEDSSDTTGEINQYNINEPDNTIIASSHESDALSPEAQLNETISLAQTSDLESNSMLLVQNSPEGPYVGVSTSKGCSNGIENNCTEETENNRAACIVPDFKTHKVDEAQEVPDMKSHENKITLWENNIQRIPSDVWDSFSKPSTSKEEQTANFQVPKPGTPVSPKMVKKAGPYLLGPLIGTSPVKSIVQCLARKAGTDKFYTIKILTFKDDNEYETQDDRQGKMLLHAEYSVLSLLQTQDGVIHHHGFFKDCALEEKNSVSGVVYTGRIKRRLCLVLDCLTAHDFNPRNDELLNLQHHVIREKKLSEKETLLIFTDTVRIVACLHKRNIVHRDLKLGNLVLNRRTRKVTITNFCLGKHLASETDLLKDQRGSPAYISPDVLCGKPYLGKPSDMWALGVVLFTMLYGQFPFYDSSPTQLFNKIKATNYHIPNDGRVSEGTTSLIRNLLVLEPSRRLTAVEVLDSLSAIIATFKVPTIIGEEEQIVPDIDQFKEECCDNKKVDKKEDEKKIGKFSGDFFKQVTLQEQMQQILKQQQSPLVTPPRLYGQIPVHRVDSDPRELTAAELDRFKHLIPRDVQRQQGHSHNRSDGILLRVRGASRNRQTAANHASQSRSDRIGEPNTLPNALSDPPSFPDDTIGHVQPQGISNPTTSSTPNANGPLNNSSVARTDIYNIDIAARSARSLRELFENSRSRLLRLSRSLNATESPLSRRMFSGNSSTHALTMHQAIAPVNQNRGANPNVVEGNIHSIEAHQPLATELSQNRLLGAVAQVVRNSESQNRPNFMTAMQSRSSLSTGSNTRAPTDINRPSGELNRSVPDLTQQSQQNRFREAIVDRLISFRIRMQQNRMDNIERELNVQNGLASLMSNTTGLSERRREILSRRSTLAHNRHTPYSTNIRHSSVHRSSSNLTEVRRTNSDSNLSRAIESVMNALNGDNRHSRYSTERNSSLRPTRTNHPENITADDSNLVTSNEHDTNSGNLVNTLQSQVTGQSEAMSALARDSALINASPADRNSILFQRSARLQLASRSQRNANAALRNRFENDGRR